MQPQRKMLEIIIIKLPYKDNDLQLVLCEHGDARGAEIN
jgi:hypothetical protein